jgi:urease accessory protein
VLPGLLVLLAAGVAHAHSQVSDSGGGFARGFLHPLSGLDHVLAVAFPLVMSFGGVAGILGVPLPSVEAGIVLSVIVLGAMIALDRRPPLLVAGVLVAFFAIFHGYAHGLELPSQAGAVAYSAGFVLATGLIHLSGSGIGFVTELDHGTRILRAGGTAISLTGVFLGWQLLVS